MKRHDSLLPLSRDHHHALVLARALKKDADDKDRAGLPAGADDLLAWARNRFERELVPHFAIEEAELVPRSEAAGGALAAQAGRVLDDHRALRALLANPPPGALAATLDAFADRLIEHIRFEERTWFPALEVELGDALGPLAPRLLGRMPRLPAHVTEYKRTPTFDEQTMPAGLRARHTLKADTWGEIVVTAGRLLYVIEDEDDLSFVLRPGVVGIVAPERPHHVTPEGRVTFHVRFLRA